MTHVTSSGPLPLLLLGITYATVKDDDQDGLSYPHFLDALLEMAFECGRNVAADLQAGAASRRAKEEMLKARWGWERGGALILA